MYAGSMALTGKQKRHLRGLGHGLKPVVHIGRAGLTAGVVEQADRALEDHELIKIRVGDGFDGEFREAVDRLAGDTRADVAGTVGHTALLYRGRDEDPEIVLP